MHTVAIKKVPDQNTCFVLDGNDLQPLYLWPDGLLHTSKVCFPDRLAAITAIEKNKDLEIGTDELAAVGHGIEILPELPDDLADAFEGMKLAIMRHSHEQWDEISLDDVRRTLKFLDQLAVGGR